MSGFLGIMLSIIFFVTPEKFDRIQVWPYAASTNSQTRELSLTFQRTRGGWCPDFGDTNQTTCMVIINGLWVDERGKTLLDIKSNLRVSNGTNYVFQPKDWNNPLEFTAQGSADEKVFEIKEGGKVVRQFRVKMFKSSQNASNNLLNSVHTNVPSEKAQANGTLPQIRPAILIQNVTNSYATCASFEDHGTAYSKEIANGETNIAQSVFQVQFLRNKAFELTLNVDRKYGVGPYSLIYYWDGSKWSSYDSIETHYGLNPVHTNTDIAGSGAASTFGLIPPLPVLLKLSPGYFSEMRLFAYDRAQVSVERLKGKWVYHLRLENNLGEGSLLDDYWIRPMDWLVLKHRRHEVFLPSAGTTNVVTRETVHFPKINSGLTTNLIFFDPPTWSPPHVTYSGGDGLTPKDAIIVHGVSNKDELLTFEIERLKAVYPGFHLGDMTDASSEGKSYDKFTITTSDGKHRVVYFLIPEFNDSKPH